jgi:hypothetical protein
MAHREPTFVCIDAIVLLIDKMERVRRREPDPAVSEGQRGLRRHVRRRHLEGMIEFDSAPTKYFVQLRFCISLSKKKKSEEKRPLARSLWSPT